MITTYIDLTFWSIYISSVFSTIEFVYREIKANQTDKTREKQKTQVSDVHYIDKQKRIKRSLCKKRCA